jgi:hypothetical protein
MKFLALQILFSIIIFTNVCAQEVINPVLGLNFSALTSDPPGLESQLRVGWHIGLNGRFGSRFYFQPGVHYAILGKELTSVEDIDTLKKGSFKSDVHALRIPLLVGMQLINTEEKESPFNINVHAGLSGAVILSISDNTTVKKEDFVSPIFSGVFGVGVDLLFLTFEVDYEVGLTKVFDETKRIVSDAKNNAVLMTLGGKFRL